MTEWRNGWEIPRHGIINLCLAGIIAAQTLHNHSDCSLDVFVYALLYYSEIDSRRLTMMELLLSLQCLLTYLF